MCCTRPLRSLAEQPFRERPQRAVSVASPVSEGEDELFALAEGRRLRSSEASVRRQGQAAGFGSTSWKRPRKAVKSSVAGSWGKEGGGRPVQRRGNLSGRSIAPSPKQLALLHAGLRSTGLRFISLNHWPTHAPSESLELRVTAINPLDWCSAAEHLALTRRGSSRYVRRWSRPYFERFTSSSKFLARSSAKKGATLSCSHTTVVREAPIGPRILTRHLCGPPQGLLQSGPPRARVAFASASDCRREPTPPPHLCELAPAILRAGHAGL